MTGFVRRGCAVLTAAGLALGVAAAFAQSPPTPTPTPSPSASPAPTPGPASTPAQNPTPGATPETPAASSSPAPSPSTPAATSSPTPTPSPSVQAADAFGAEETLTAKTVVILKGTAEWDSAFDTLTDSIKALQTLLRTQNITPAGNPMIVYTSTDDSGFTFMAEIPVDQEPRDLGKNMSMGKSPEGRALKFVHRGSYDNMDNTYEAITNYLDEKKLEAKDSFIEEYAKDPLTTAEDELVINVYVPLK